MNEQPRIFCRGQKTTGPDEHGETGMHLAEARKQWLRVREAKVLSSGRAQRWVEYPILWIDVSSRPEVLDLGRVLMSEGKGEGTANWRYERDLTAVWVCVLRVQVQQPVVVSFDVPFALPFMQRMLEGIARTNELFLCFGPYRSVFDAEDKEGVSALSKLLSDSAPDVIAIEFDMLARAELVACLLGH